MSKAIQKQFDELRKRAARRSMTIRKAEELGEWELANPFRVVCHGSLDNVEAWLTAAEQLVGCPPPASQTLGVRADG